MASSECSPEQLDTLLTEATTQGDWLKVCELLNAGGSHEKRVWVIEQACKTAGDFKKYILPHVDDDFLSQCSSEQLDSMLTTATKRGWGHMVHILLKAGGSHEKRVWVIEQTCEKAGYIDFKDYILPHVDCDFLSQCSTNQLNNMLTTATKRGLWTMVHKVLQYVKTGINHGKRVWVIEQACGKARYLVFNNYILRHVDGDFLSQCSTNQLDNLLTTATTQGLWRMVEKMLWYVKAGFSDEKRVWVIEQACEKAGYLDFEDFILPHVDDDFLSQCSTDQLDNFLTTATTRPLWNMVHKVLKAGGSHEKRVWVIEQACETAGYIDFEDYILPHVDGDFLSHCSTVYLDTLLTTATTRCLWHMVHNVLKAGGSCGIRVWVIEQACVTPDKSEFDHYILQHVDDDFLSQCSTEQLDTLLTAATTRRLWNMVDKVFTSGGSHEICMWVIEQACEKARYLDLKNYIMPHVDVDFLSQCSTEQLDTLLTTATKRGLGHMVHNLVKAGGSHGKRVGVIEQACEKADKCKFELDKLPHINDNFLSQCSTEQLDTLLTKATKRGLWRIVHKVLKAGSSREKLVWVIEQACKKAGYIDFKIYVMPHVDGDFLSQCSTEYLHTLLTTATTRGLWHMVDKILKTGISHEKRAWVIKQACVEADKFEFWRNILPHVDDDFLSYCSTEYLDTLLTTATTRGLWDMVDKVLKAGGSCGIRVWVIEQACEKAGYKDFDRYILPHVDGDLLSQCSTEQLDTLLTTATTRGLGHMVHKVLEAGGSHEKRVWVIEQACENVEKFGRYVLPPVDGDFIFQCSSEQLDRLLTVVKTRGLWHMVHKVLDADGSREKRVRVIEQACKTVDCKDFVDYILPDCNEDQLDCALQHCVRLGEWKAVGEVLTRGGSEHSRTWALYEACKCFTYTTVLEWIDLHFEEFEVRGLVSSLSSDQLSRETHNVALRFALRQRRWDVISQASLSQVWEQVRRHLFREAVNQRQWTMVKKWSDHTLYDDERWWALEEAYKLRQWGVMLRLADHGLTEIELMRVRYRLAKHADWSVVVRMIERGVDVTEVREVVQSVMKSRKTAADEAKRREMELRWKELRQLEDKLTRASVGRLTLPTTAGQWDTVLFHLHRHPGAASLLSSRHQPRKTFGELLLRRAIKQRAWHVVMHLVTLGLDTDQLDSLLTDMIRRRQWGVCRVLLEQGVSVLSCLSALPVFMKMNQWNLVARVMEFIGDDALKRRVEQLALDRNVGSLVWRCVSAMCRYGMCVGDAVRLNVMQRAMERRQGSVVGECISTMQHYRLSMKEREELFQQAIKRGVLQAVKPLVEKKDQTDIQHRDATLLAAIEQRQWDVVDCCQLKGADIDMKDERGETPLIREARREEWKAVEELAVRGADPNVLDTEGCSVLNRAIYAKQLDLVCLLIECLANIHESARYEPEQEYEPCTNVLTPLQFLIDRRHADIIDHTLIWSPDQARGVNDEGETTLHAIALGKKPQLLYYQIVRGVNPLTLTNEGHSVLLYAVRNKHCPQKMVAECIRLGLSTHQPRLTQRTAVDVIQSVSHGLRRDSYDYISSPFLLAVLRGKPVVAQMLYESGSCSSTELLHLYTTLVGLSDPRTIEGRALLNGQRLSFNFTQEDADAYKQRYVVFMTNMITFLPKLREMVSTPRSLESSCRLVISNCLTVSRRHVRDVQDLPPSVNKRKAYLLFSDLTDPQYSGPRLLRPRL